VAARAGTAAARRGASADEALLQRVETLPDEGRTRLARFGPYELLDARVEPLGGRRYLASFDWRLAGLNGPLFPAVAVSQLAGVADARIVHLPSFALLPQEVWRSGRVVREQFELELPAELPAGVYSWQVGWYDLGHVHGYATDERSALGTAFTVATIEVR
jgi:hypothetical protein